MFRYQQLVHYHMSGRDQWDLCIECWGEFRRTFIGEGRAR